jgi:ABC-2 type transport system permease protein
MSDLILLLLPGTMYFWILFIGQTPMQDIFREKESRVLPRILSCPVAPGQYLMAKLLRCFVLCSLAMVLLLLVSAVLFGIKWGSPLRLALTVTTWGVSMTGFLALLFGGIRTREQANIISPVVFMTCALVGGSMFPFENLPPFLQTLGQFTPNRWGVEVLLGSVRGKPLAELVRPFVELWALGLLGSLAGLGLFRRQLAHATRP